MRAFLREMGLLYAQYMGIGCGVGLVMIIAGLIAHFFFGWTPR